MYYLAVDVEATCSTHGAIPRSRMEIIEIGAVLLDDSFHPVGEFQTFVKPFLNPTLTTFCKQLTSITQKDVATAPSIYDACSELGAWLKDRQPLSWYSWGDYDYEQFKLDCKRSGAAWPFPGEHYNAKKLYVERFGSKPGLQEAIEERGLEWMGTHHRGIDDARNLAFLLPTFLMSEEDKIQLLQDSFDSAEKQAEAGTLIDGEDFFKKLNSGEFDE